MGLKTIERPDGSHIVQTGSRWTGWRKGDVIDAATVQRMKAGEPVATPSGNIMQAPKHRECVPRTAHLPLFE